MTTNYKDIPLLERISDYAALHASRTPNATSLVIEDSRTSYAALQEQIDRVAKGLIAAGIRKGDRVATLSTPHPDFFIIFLASASIGAIWLGLNPRYKIDEYRFVADDSGFSMLFSRTDAAGRNFVSDIEALRSEYASIGSVITLDQQHDLPGSVSLGEFVAGGANVSDEMLEDARKRVTTRDPAALIYTSGTTGKPKGAMITHRGLCRVFHAQLSYMPANPSSMVNFLPINHIGSLGDISAYLLIAGGTVIFMERFDAAGWLALMEKEKATIWGGVPTTVQMCLALPEFDSYDLSAVQHIWFGGAAPAREVLEVLLDKFDATFINTYGQTETTSTVCYAGPSRSVTEICETIGGPPDGFEVRVINDDGRPADVGVSGEIQVRGDFIMKGYWNRPEATREAIDDEGWLHTGDLVRQRNDGKLEFIGRIKEMFKSGGYNVYPLEIEAVLEAHPSVDVAVVVSVPDKLYGEVGYAFVQSARGRSTNSHELIEHCNTHLANYKIPKTFDVRDVLATLPIGKVDRKALKLEAATLV